MIILMFCHEVFFIKKYTKAEEFNYNINIAINFIENWSYLYG